MRQVFRTLLEDGPTKILDHNGGFLLQERSCILLKNEPRREAAGIPIVFTVETD